MNNPKPEPEWNWETNEVSLHIANVIDLYEKVGEKGLDPDEIEAAVRAWANSGTIEARCFMAFMASEKGIDWHEAAIDWHAIAVLEGWVDIDAIEERLEDIRVSIRSESISYGEIVELQSLADHIDDGDIELLQWAGVPE